MRSAHQRLPACYVAVVFVVSGGADEAYLAAFEVRLEHVGGIERSVAARTACPNHIVYLVDVEYGVTFSGESFHHLLDALLEVAAELRPCYHRSHVHHVDARLFEAVGHVATGNACSQSVDQCCLADTSLADVQRIVLVLAAEHLDGAFEFSVAADERIVPGVSVGYACHKLAPCLTLWFGFAPGRVGADDGFPLVVVGHKRRHELAMALADESIELIGSARLFEHEHCGYDLGHVDNVDVGILRLAHGESHHLRELMGALDGIEHAFGHTLKRVEIFAY